MWPAVKPVTCKSTADTHRSSVQKRIWQVRDEHTQTHLMLVMLPVSEPSLHLSSWLATICRSASSSLVRRSNCNSWRERGRERCVKSFCLFIYGHICSHPEHYFSPVVPVTFWIVVKWTLWSVVGGQACVCQFHTGRNSLRRVWYVAKLWHHTTTAITNVAFVILRLGKSWNRWSFGMETFVIVVDFTWKRSSNACLINHLYAPTVWICILLLPRGGWCEERDVEGCQSHRPSWRICSCSVPPLKETYYTLHSNICGLNLILYIYCICIYHTENTH